MEEPSLSPEKKFYLERRDEFHQLDDKMDREILDYRKGVIKEKQAMRRHFATISFAIGGAIIPLALLSNAHPKHQVLFPVGASLLVLNGVIMTLTGKRQLDLEDIGGIGLLLETKRDVRRVYHLSNRGILEDIPIQNYMEQTEKLGRSALEQNKKPTKSWWRKISFELDIGILLLILPLTFIASELVPPGLGWWIAYWMAIGTILSVFLITILIQVFKILLALERAERVQKEIDDDTKESFDRSSASRR